MTTRAGEGLPVNLGRIAKECQVRSVTFQPLLVDGGLAVTNDGFHIYVRSEPNDGVDLTRLFLEDGTGRTLPLRIAKRARFTIAHEIAHTLMYDMSGESPRHWEEITPATLPALEHTCNVVAAALLLPERIFEREFHDLDLLDPEALFTIAEHACVSKTALVWRLTTLRRVPHPLGLVARAEREGENWRFTATSVHYSLREIFSSVCAGSQVSSVVEDDDFVLNGGSECSIRVKIRHDDGEKMFQFNVNRRTSRSCFLTARPLFD